MKKLWGGRFQEQSADWLNKFGSSISFDYQLAAEDIQGSIAHVNMLAAASIISPAEKDQIKAGLLSILADIEENQFNFSLANEDIHLNIEQALHERIGSVAGKLHTARSRNDQVATDMHLYLKKQVSLLIELVTVVQRSILSQAEQNIDTLIPGYTHLQHAQPISFAHHLLAYFQMLQRDKARLEDSLKRIDISPLGCAALAGTTFPIDRFQTAEELGFSAVYDNSLDGVSDRDFILEFLSNASILMMHLSRFCEELILWTSFEFQFIELADAYATGSSIMPQKKNSDYAELIRGKTGRVYGHLLGLLTTLKGLPLAYNKDLQEDKEGMFDTVTTLTLSLRSLAGMIDTMTVNKNIMEESTNKDFSNATELADYLASNGVPFRQAHEIVGELVLSCIQQGIYLQDIPLSDYQKINPTITDDIYTALDSRVAMNRRTSYGGTSRTEIKKMIKKNKHLLD
ncbi:argininosuccinate lyase [Vagococcus vulneris]|uniref:Argininosuccinate lyase n=1 Tax=Vagococcus vulneris TaxID=1977869 RepID=A0A430A1C6_9ENTE|nr:argininosuccinate lyase [Vagococcus vulneris]RSU00211.1 argininosuccinate lyase [Vagococcus vulneris]